jgi:hypothetical protein
MALYQNGTAPTKPIGSEVQLETLPAIYPPRGIAESDAAWAARVAAWGARTRTISYTNNSGVTVTTAALAFSADDETIEAAMESLAGIGAGNMKVSGDGIKFTYSFTGALANTGFQRMYSTEVANGIRNYFETIQSGFSEATQELVRADITDRALSAAGISEPGFANEFAPVPADIGQAARYAGNGRVYREEFSGTVSGGTRAFTVNGQTTAAIAYNASAATIQAALEALSNVASGDVVVVQYGSTAGQFEYRWGGAFQGVGIVTMTEDPALLTGGGTATLNLYKEGSTVVPQFA